MCTSLARVGFTVQVSGMRDTCQSFRGPCCRREHELWTWRVGLSVYDQFVRTGTTRSRARTRLEYSAHPRISHSLRTHCAVVSSLCIPRVPCEPLNVYCCRFSLFSVQIISNYVYNLSSCSSNSVSALQNGLIIHTNTYIHIYIYICINVCARVYVWSMYGATTHKNLICDLLWKWWLEWRTAAAGFQDSATVQVSNWLRFFAHDNSRSVARAPLKRTVVCMR